ncbi:glutamate decarboxylase [Favolaschia claudopus]|uniref:Glutamate decarboxylase n=1 Tax=Favolaschia claudopus TaxID=2862362 RepID=A0AAW0E6K1_9AGAR
MSLSRHINADEVIEKSKEHPHRKHTAQEGRQTFHQSWSRDEDAARAPKYTIPEVGIPSKAAYQLLHDETALDGNPLLNLASFVHTWMPPEANQLIMENINKNQVDLDEYPAATIIHNRCISMLADLWKAPKDTKAIGTSTAGSSEAIMLGGLALKKKWQEARKAAGKDHYHPNIVFGSNAQVALEKFARYWDVEARLVPVNASTNYVMNPHDAIPFIDENTIGVMVILGSTYTGHFEDVQLMSDLLDDLEKRTGLDIPIHVDGASGAFVAPFAYPNYKWAFDVKRVHSINTSGHKFGLVYAGLGWILWKDESMLHKDLIFELHYLGSVEYSFTLNFSKPAAPIIAQMYNFLNLGFDGYRRIAIKDLRNARMLSRALEATYFKVLSNIHKPSKNQAVTDNDDSDDPELYERGLPVVSFKLSDKFIADYPHVQQAWIQSMLRTKGWIAPNYNAPEGEAETEMLRIVVRETLSEDLCERLIVDILEITEALMGTSMYSRSTFVDPSSPTHAAGVATATSLPHSSAFSRVPSHSAYARPDDVVGEGSALAIPSSLVAPIAFNPPYAPSESSSSSSVPNSPLLSFPQSLPVAALHQQTLPARVTHTLLLPFSFLFHMFTAFFFLTSLHLPFSFFSSPSRPSQSGSAVMLSKTLHQPDKDHGRPEKANFGDGDNEGGVSQSGFARQC